MKVERRVCVGWVLVTWSDGRFRPELHGPLGRYVRLSEGGDLLLDFDHPVAMSVIAHEAVNDLLRAYDDWRDALTAAAQPAALAGTGI